ncbi:MAG TPA: M20/M25/M40 family metallo-hydrolase [Candidatus Limnocylindria bacterium]|nr:M20/M25/M40 family metallo-hydrolase [Candidatus Limnocylindria bacterium]
MTSDTAEVTDLLQHLIRNACVNDGTPASGNEDRSVSTLRAYLEPAGAEVATFAELPGRGNLVVRIEGTDAKAPSLLLMGHTDVVPANPAGWRHDPFGGEIVDGEIWGRGAVDMLNITSSMAVALKRLLTERWRGRGTLIYLAVADEEALGSHGAGWLTDHHWDAIGADFVLSESGGVRYGMTREGAGHRVGITVAEKGTQWSTIRVTGTPGHGSAPYGMDSAVVKAAAVVQRIAAYRPPVRIGEVWRGFVRGMAFPEEVERALVSERLDDALPTLPVGLAKMAHASTRTTFAPNVLRGGTKTNVIPDDAIVEVDIRTLPGQSPADVRALLRDAIGDLWDQVEVTDRENTSTASRFPTPLSDLLGKVSSSLIPGATLVPAIAVGGTDNRFFRRKGSTAYGYALFSPQVTFEKFRSMFHGNDERVDPESLRLSTELWYRVAKEFLA